MKSQFLLGRRLQSQGREWTIAAGSDLLRRLEEFSGVIGRCDYPGRDNLRGLIAPEGAGSGFALFSVDAGSAGYTAQHDLIGIGIDHLFDPYTTVEAALRDLLAEVARTSKQRVLVTNGFPGLGPAYASVGSRLAVDPDVQLAEPELRPVGIIEVYDRGKASGPKLMEARAVASALRRPLANSWTTLANDRLGRLMTERATEKRWRPLADPNMKIRTEVKLAESHVAYLLGEQDYLDGSSAFTPLRATARVPSEFAVGSIDGCVTLKVWSSYLVVPEDDCPTLVLGLQFVWTESPAPPLRRAVLAAYMLHLCCELDSIGKRLDREQRPAILMLDVAPNLAGDHQDLISGLRRTIENYNVRRYRNDLPVHVERAIFEGKVFFDLPGGMRRTGNVEDAVRNVQLSATADGMAIRFSAAEMSSRAADGMAVAAQLRREKGTAFPRSPGGIVFAATCPTCGATMSGTETSMGLSISYPAGAEDKCMVPAKPDGALGLTCPDFYAAYLEALEEFHSGFAR